MAAPASCFVIKNTFVSTIEPTDEEPALSRRMSWPAASPRSYEILGFGVNFEDEVVPEEEAKAGVETGMKSHINSSSTFEGETHDRVSMSHCCSNGSSTRCRALEHVQVSDKLIKEEEHQQLQQQQQHQEEEDPEDSEEAETKSRSKLKASVQRPSKTTRVKCKAVAQRAIDAAMETNSPEAIQVLVNLASQTPYMRSLVRHALEELQVMASVK
mmetsp:Transcript_8533/g.18980  ORF Transcript_8533/g.18980 Transcript_8533/m.18980 type:complete len:214 (-) Transcript_8533:138-779(-)